MCFAWRDVEMPNNSGAPGIERVHENQDFHVKRLWIDGVLFDPEAFDPEGFQSQLDSFEAEMMAWAADEEAARNSEEALLQGQIDTLVAGQSTQDSHLGTLDSADTSHASSISTHASEIAALQSSVSAIVVPSASNAAPPAIGSSAQGASARYARQDHNHAADPQTATNTANIATNTTNIATNTTNITTLQGQVGGIPAASNADPLVDAVAAAQGVSTRYSRQDHAHPLPAWTVSTPSRTLNSAGYQPSTTKYVLCLYTVSISAQTTIGGGQDGTIELRSDSNSTPTTVRGVSRLRQVATLAIALQLDQNQTGQLCYLVPPGHYVRLVSTASVGAPTFGIVNQVEIAFG